MSILDHDVLARQAERDALAAATAAWIAKHGQPVCHPPHVTAATRQQNHILATMDEKREKARRQRKAMPV